MTTTDKVSFGLVMVGGLNWGLIGFFEWSFVDEIFSDGLARVIYAAVGVATVYMLLKMSAMADKQSTKEEK